MEPLKHALTGLLLLVVLLAVLWLTLGTPQQSPPDQERAAAPPDTTAPEPAEALVRVTDYVSEPVRVAPDPEPRSAPVESDLPEVRLEERTPFDILTARDTESSDRFAVVHRLSLEMTREEMEGIYTFLSQITHLDGFNPSERQLFAEVLFQRIQSQRRGAPGFADALLTVYRDQTADPIIRGYAVQHIGIWLENGADAPEAQNALWNIASTHNMSQAGIALFALDRLERGDHDVDADRLLSVAMAILEDPDSDLAVRMGALDVAARRGDARARLHARALVENAPTVPARLAALHALGRIGAAEDREVLERWSAGADTLYHRAAQTALERLDERTRI